MKLQNGDVFLVVEKKFIDEIRAYEKTWPEEKEDNPYLNIMEKHVLSHRIEFSPNYLIMGPARIYTAKKISEEEAYKWYEVSVYYWNGPESSNANATSLITNVEKSCFRIMNDKTDLIY